MDERPAETDFLNCPRPLPHDHIIMAHGGGGRIMHELIAQVFLPACAKSAGRHDGAIVPIQGARLAMTTDSFVVRPLFFPGGDIGKLAVCGTINDLAMCGARPDVLSVAVVLEEGLPIEQLRIIVASMHTAAREAGVQIVTGDTKVVERGHGDGIYINTSGIGWVADGCEIGPWRVRPDDAIIVSGDIGRHGVALLAVREGLAFECPIASDCAPLHAPVMALLDAGIKIHCLRDLTRGGLASALVEIAEMSDCSMRIDERRVPIADEIRGACEILGLDPFHVANEGRFCAFVPKPFINKSLEVLRSFDVSRQAQAVGEVTSRQDGMVVLQTRIGTERVMDMPSGELLPRIC